MNRIRKSIAVKSIAGIILLLTFFSVIVGKIGYEGFTNAQLSEYADGAFKAAHTAALSVDANELDAYKESLGRGQKYLNVWTQLARTCNSTQSTFIYVIEPDPDYKHITFWFSTVNTEAHYTLYPFGYYRETTNEDYEKKYKAIMEDGSERELVLRDQGDIETDPHITAMVPLKTKEGDVVAIMCVQRQMEDLVEARNKFLNGIFAALMGLAIIAVTVLWLYLRVMLLKPVQEITQEASRFAKENIYTESKLTDTIRNKDEIGVLAASIDQMEEQVRTYVNDLKDVTAREERISTELTLATQIQIGMLPHNAPDRREFALAASMRPAREVGGDFYDYFMIDDDHLCMVIADVSGKGIPAALFMMASKIILANNAKMGRSPAQILEQANKSICDNNELEMFVTVWLGILEISTGKLTAANAGHEYPALLQPGGQFELYKDKHGFVIGGMEGMRYTEYELQMQPGTKLFLYTDGVPEATDMAKSMFGTNRMLDVLNRNKDASPKRILDAVSDAAGAFVAGAEQFDDLTMLCLEYKGTKA